MKASDVRAKTLDELNDNLASLKKEQFNLRFQKATGQLEKTARVKQVRKDIARIQTAWRDCRRAHAQDGSFLFGAFATFWQLAQVFLATNWLKNLHAGHKGHEFVKPPRLLAAMAPVRLVSRGAP